MLAENLKRCREQLGLTQQMLAERAGISTPRISEIEQGHQTNPRLRTLERIAEALGIGVGVLVGETPRSGAAAPGRRKRASAGRGQSNPRGTGSPRRR